MNDAEISIEHLRPRQIREARDVLDLAFLPVGNLEWHGLHNPIGLDLLKAHSVCCASVRQLRGGLVFPPVIWGTPRDSFHVGIDSPKDISAEISKHLGTTRTKWKGEGNHGGMDRQEQWLFFQRLLRMSLEHISGFGFKSIYVCSGHGPFINWIKPVCIAFARSCQITDEAVNIDFGNVHEAAGLRGDHAGEIETSALMAVYPETVALEELKNVPEMKDVGVGRTAIHSSREKGESLIGEWSKAIAEEGKWLVDNYPKQPARHGNIR